ncbi:hypothetical protein I79_004286 [Cricetulus griseus]|uniref:Uncharacterized protein n=1 Tax=Cricetulus griseus TaxID=10029 RepID=G3H242_CRIGR|nr:hypothetical protein I79_004286 [Cricetulus griseus]
MESVICVKKQLSLLTEEGMNIGQWIGQNGSNNKELDPTKWALTAPAQGITCTVRMHISPQLQKVSLYT